MTDTILEPVHKVNIFHRVRIESSNSRPAKPEKCDFTFVNDHFEGKHNVIH